MKDLHLPNASDVGFLLLSRNPLGPKEHTILAHKGPSPQTTFRSATKPAKPSLLGRLDKSLLSKKHRFPSFFDFSSLRYRTLEKMAEGDEDLPRDAKIVKSLLKSMGVEDYEPRVIHQFLELWYRYVVDVLTDAQVYSEHAGKAAIDCDDLKLAIQSKVNFSFSQPPPREVLLELARNRNKIPLQKSIAGHGIPLPPEQDTLISPNYQLAIPRKQSAQAVEETEEDDEAVDPTLPSQEQKVDLPQQTQQRVSFPLVKRTK